MLDIRKWSAAAIVFVLLSDGASAAIMTYTDRTAFENTLGTFITDTYSDPGYSFSQTDVDMSAVLGETDYTATGFTNNNLVHQGKYCAGCNGSFKLSFTTTSVGDATGVFGVGFDITINNASLPYDAYAVFGDGSTVNFDLGTGGGRFFGITSDRFISSLSLGLPNGGTTRSGGFQIDNLTIGNRVPEPATILLLSLGLIGIASASSRQSLRR